LRRNGSGTALHVDVDTLTERLDGGEQNAPEAFGTPVTAAKALGYFFGRSSKYGEFDPDENCAVIPLDAWQDGDGSLPADISEKMCRVLRTVGRGYISNTAIPYVTSEWDKVMGVIAGVQEGPVWAHEPNSRDEAAGWVADARRQMTDLDLAPRPVVIVLREELAADAQFAGVADILAPELYFTGPEATYDEMLAHVKVRFAAVIAALSPTPLCCCIQAFDRNRAGWKQAPWAMEAIQHAANEAIVSNRIIGLWWFAYARPGGVRDYPQLEPWHVRQIAVTPVPPLPTDPIDPPDPPDEDEMTHDDVRRYAAAIGNELLFGAYKRFHDEVLARDRALDSVIKSAAYDPAHPDAQEGQMWTGDFTTGGAMSIFTRAYMPEAIIAQDKGRTPEQASGDGYDKGIAAYRKTVGITPPTQPVSGELNGPIGTSGREFTES
jgi:hypothetical protein